MIHHSPQIMHVAKKSFALAIAVFCTMDE